MKRIYRVKDLAGKTIAKCKTKKGQIGFANNCNKPVVCFTLIQE